MTAKFDFREGMLLEKVVYKDTSCDWKSCLMYTGCLIFCYSWGCAWFALFFWAYINYENITFWVFIACWLVHMGIIIGIGANTLHKSKLNRIKKIKEREERAKQQEKIEQAKRKKFMQETEYNENKENNDEKQTHNPIQTETAALNP